MLKYLYKTRNKLPFLEFCSVVFAGLLTVCGAVSSASATLFSSAGVSAVQGSNTQIFSEFSTGTDFASEVGLASEYRASAIAQTAFRSNHITASAGKDTTSGFSSAGATSRWSDGLFFGGGTPGTTAFATFVFLLSGSIEGGDTVSFDFEFDTEDEYCCSDNIGHVFRGPTSVSGFEISLVVEFTFNSEANGDEPLFIEGELSGGATVGRGDTGDVLTNFGNSAILTQVILPDGVNISSLSGTDYSEILGASSAAVPEPGPVALLAIGLVGLAAVRGTFRGRS